MTEGVPGEPPESGEFGVEGSIAEQERRRFAEYEHVVGFRERMGYTDMAYKTRPEEVRHDTRKFTGLTERLWFLYEQQPNTYLIDYTLIPALVTRADQLMTSLPLGFGEYSAADKKAKLVQGKHLYEISGELWEKGDLEERDGEEYFVVDGKPLGKYETKKDVQTEKRNDKEIVTERERKFFVVEVSEKEARKNREALAVEYSRSAREIQAYKVLLGKVAEQNIFAGEVEAYMVRAFENFRKIRADSHHYAEILNLPPTYEGFRPLGEKTEKAFNSYIEIAEGRAIIDVTVKKPDGTEAVEKRALPNLFAMPRNWGLLQLAIDKYVIPELGYQTSEDEDPKSLALRRLEEFDNYSAAISGLMLFRHWDFDSFYGVGAKGYDKVIGIREISERDLRVLGLELGWTDSTKAMHFETRRASEWSEKGPGGERRDHPRKVGSPSTLGCYPSLTSHALDIVSVEVLGRNKDKFRETQKFRVSVYDMVYGEGVVQRERSEENEEKGFGKKNELVTWEFDKAESLGDRRIWDNIDILEGGEILDISPADKSFLSESEREALKGKTINIALGVPTDAYEVPYKLQGFLAYTFMYAQFTRTDYFKQYEEITKGNLLLSMNKGIDNALGLLKIGHNLDNETFDKLNDYVRTVFLGGLAASIIKHGARGKPVGLTLERKPQVSDMTALEGNVLISELEEAARVARFLEFREKEGKGPVLNPRQKKLFEYIATNRKAPTPFDLEKAGLKDWFTSKQLEKIRRLYPLLGHK